VLVASGKVSSASFGSCISPITGFNSSGKSFAASPLKYQSLCSQIYLSLASSLLWWRSSNCSHFGVLYERKKVREKKREENLRFVRPIHSLFIHRSVQINYGHFRALALTECCITRRGVHRPTCPNHQT